MCRKKKNCSVKQTHTRGVFTLSQSGKAVAVVSMLLPILVWTSGCGESAPDKETASTDKSQDAVAGGTPSTQSSAKNKSEPASTEDSNTGTVTDTAGEPPDGSSQSGEAEDENERNKTAGKHAKKPENRTSRRDEQPDIADLKNALHDIRDIRQRGEFHKAYRKAQQAFQVYYKHFRTKKPFKELRALRGQLAREQRVVTRLQPAYQALGSDSEPRRKMAQKKFRRHPDLAPILLRKAIREGSVRGALTAVQVLRNALTVGTAELATCSKRAIQTDHQPLQTALLNTLRANPEHLTADIVIRLTRHAAAAGPDSILHTQVTRILRRTAEQSALPEKALRRVYEQVTKDETFTFRLLASYLAEVYRHRNSVTDEADFDKLLGADHALDTLRQYAAQAAESDDPRLSAWGKKHRAMLKFLGEFQGFTMDFEQYEHGTTPEDITGWTSERGTVRVDAEKFADTERGNVMHMKIDNGQDDWQKLFMFDFPGPLSIPLRIEYKYWETGHNHDGNLWIKDGKGRPLIGAGTENPQWEVAVRDKGEVVNDADQGNEYEHWIHVVIRIEPGNNRAKVTFNDLADDNRKTYGWFELPAFKAIGGIALGPDAAWYVDDIKVRWMEAR